MNIERQIEFDKVKDMWAALAVTDWAKEKIREAATEVSVLFILRHGIVEIACV